PLPLGAAVAHAEFTPYWPKGTKSHSSGGIGRWGSYGSQIGLDSTSVHWENACQGVYGGKNLYYRVSFVISIPAGMDLGEEAFDPASPKPPTCAPIEFTSVEQSNGTETPPNSAPTGPTGPSLIAHYCFLNSVGTEPFQMTVDFKGSGPSQATFSQ